MNKRTVDELMGHKSVDPNGQKCGKNPYLMRIHWGQPDKRKKLYFSDARNGEVF